MMEKIKNRNILALWKLPLAFIKGHRGIIGETHEHGDVFFYLMPSNMGPQRAASNPAKRDNSSLFFRVFVGVHPDYRDLPARICEGMIKKDISMLIHQIISKS